MKTIDGKDFAQNLREKIKDHVTEINENANITPGLAVVLVGEDPASQVYVKNKGIQTKNAGMNEIGTSIITIQTTMELAVSNAVNFFTINKFIEWKKAPINAKIIPREIRSPPG